MGALAVVIASCLAIQTAQSYILLTANIEDVHAIAKQLADSPVAEQLNKIWRRASNQFSAHFDRTGRSGGRREDDSLPASGRNNLDPKYEEQERQTNLNLSENQLASESERRSDNDREGTENSPDDGLDGRRKMRRRRTNNEDQDMVALGRNASVYLKSIRRMLQDI